MEQYGIIVRANGKQADVLVRQHSACASCGKCNMKHESKDLTVTALNLVNAQVGDRVVLEMPERNILSAGLLAYAMPLVSLFIGVLLGQLLFGSQTAAVLLGFGSMLGSYALLHLVLEPRFKASQQFSLSITDVIGTKEDHTDYGTEHEDTDHQHI